MIETTSLLVVIGWLAIVLSALSVISIVLLVSRGKLANPALAWSLVLSGSGLCIYSFHFVLRGSEAFGQILSWLGLIGWLGGAALAWISRNSVRPSTLP